MDISSVTKPAAQAMQALKRNDETENQGTKKKEPEANKVLDTAPKPVVNTQGQTTGRILNVSA